MSDETVAPSATEGTEAPAEQTTETTAPPAEAITTETQAETTEAPEKGPIPYERFAEVNSERKESKARVEELEKELESARTVTPSTPTPVQQDLSEPPDSYSQREKVDFYVRQSAGNMISEQLGMSLGEAKTLLQTIPAVSDATYEQQWQTMCKAQGLDPTDRQVQDFTRGLVKGSGYEVKDALVMVADVLKQKKVVTSQTAPQVMENGATAHTMTKESTGLVWDKDHAMQLASQGKRVDLTSASDILKAADARRKKAKAAE